MAVRHAKKDYVVNYNPLHAVLKRKKKELERIRGLVTLAAKKDIKLQLAAINRLLQCKGGGKNMSKAVFAVRMSSGKNCK